MDPSLQQATRRRFDDTALAQDGFTVVEVLVAMMLLIVGVFASFQAFDASTRASFSAQRNQTAVNRAQREMESLRSLDFDEVALTSGHSASSDPNDPRSRVSADRFKVKDDATCGTTATNDCATMVVNAVDGVAGGTIAPGPTAFTSGNVKGQIFRFVTWQRDTGCLVCSADGKHYKRVIVVVKLDAAGIAGQGKRYIEIQSDFTDPHDGILGEQAPTNSNPGQITTAQQFWLYDTQCNNTVRGDPTNHVTHNTSGSCSDSGTPQNENPNPGPPDLMWASAPPDPDPLDPANPEIKDYATEIQSESGLVEKGLKVLKQSGCDRSTTDPAKVHRWVTKPFSADFALKGRASFAFSTKTIGGSTHTGKMCTYLYKLGSGNTETTIPEKTTGTPYFTYSRSLWPSTGWTQLSYTMEFDPVTIASGDRLGFALSVESEGTQGSALQFLYDHPDHPTRLEVETSTPLSG